MAATNETDFDRFMQRVFDDLFRSFVDLLRAGDYEETGDNVSEKPSPKTVEAVLRYRNNRISWRVDPLYGSTTPE